MADVELISREELTEYLFAIQDMKLEVKAIRRLLEEEFGGEVSEDDA